MKRQDSLKTKEKDHKEMVPDFEEIAREYQRPLYNLSYRFLWNHHDADDAVQKTFMKAYEKIKSFRGESSLKTWLYKIAINVCRNLLRDKKETTHLDSNIPDTDRDKDPQTKTIENEKRHILFKKLDLLPQKQREVMLLRIYENYSFKDIAKILGQKENWAKVNYHLGMNKLKEIFKQYRE